MPRRAIVLMNLGGPDSAAGVRPFLFNLFSDPAIIGLPKLLRLPLAWAAARRRAKVAAEIYRQLGGGSPLLANTEAQAQALEAALADGSRCFIAMRYWRPTSDEAVRAVKAWAPDAIVLLPLYPQFSTTTTGSSLTAWREAAAQGGLARPTRAIESYPTADGLIAAIAGAVRAELDPGSAGTGEFRVLFSAHGLPLKIVRNGDPYPRQVEATAAAVADRLGLSDGQWRLCYQSRVGPLAWLGPSVDQELQTAGRDRVPVVVAPISFVSEHSETLVELDRDYRRLAEKSGVPQYRRAMTVGIDPRFIAALAALVNGAAP